MNILDRAKNIILTPKTEWQIIEKEQIQAKELISRYLLPLSLIPTIATFSAILFFGYDFLGPKIGWLSFGIKHAVITFLTIIVSTYVIAIVVDYFASRYNSEKNFIQTLKLIVYSYTPFAVSGICFLYLPLYFVALLAMIYGFYVLYQGIQPMLKTPKENLNNYFIVIVLSIIVVSIVVKVLFETLLSTNGYYDFGF